MLAAGNVLASTVHDGDIYNDKMIVDKALKPVRVLIT